MKRIFITFCATIIATANQLLASTKTLNECKGYTSESACREGCYWSDTPILYTEPSSDPSGPGSNTSEEIQCWGFKEYYIATQGTCPPGGFIISGDTEITCESCTTGGYDNGFTSTENSTSCDECLSPLETNNNHSKCYKRYELTFEQTKENCSYCGVEGVTCSNKQSTIKQYYEIEFNGDKYAISGCTNSVSGDANNTAELDPNATIPDIITSDNNKCNPPEKWTAKDHNISIKPGDSCQTEIANIILSNGNLKNPNLLTNITLQTEEWTNPGFTIEYYVAEFNNGIKMTREKTITGTLGEQHQFLKYTDIKSGYVPGTSCEHFTGWTCSGTSTVAGCDGETIYKPGETIQIQDTTIKIHPKTMWPANGYYCANDKPTACPAGMTSTFDSSSGKTRLSDCYIDTATVEFCNNNKQSCFSLSNLGITGKYYNITRHTAN